MPRMQRLDLPGAAQHVIQRGNDRQPCFFREVGYLRHLQDVREAALRYGCRAHAHVLMSNHVHLLVTPERSGAIATRMQAVGRRHVCYINDALRRTDTRWKGRYKPCLVNSESYVLARQRYIELNPVRAAMVATVSDYR